MSHLFWQAFIEEYSEHALEALRRADKSRLSAEEIDLSSRDTLGRPRASNEQIEQREAELGLSFPESLKDFWRASNGMTIVGFDAEDNEVFAVANVGFLRDVAPTSFKIMSETHPVVPNDGYEDRSAFPFV